MHGRSFFVHFGSTVRTTFAATLTSKFSKSGRFSARMFAILSNTDMKPTRISTLVLFVCSLLCVATALAQEGKFSDPSVDYSFDVPDDRWKMTVPPSSTKPNVEYVFIDRNDGHLEVRRLTVAKDAILGDVIREEEHKLQFLPGFVAGRDENFSGYLRGSIFNFEFVRSGRPMSGRFYFLRANETTIYILRFTGYRDKLKSIRNQTDSISRTFSVERG